MTTNAAYSSKRGPCEPCSLDTVHDGVVSWEPKQRVSGYRVAGLPAAPQGTTSTRVPITLHQLHHVRVTKAINAQLGNDQPQGHRQHDEERGRAVDNDILQEAGRRFGAERD
jgi:hypothetical protein